MNRVILFSILLAIVYSWEDTKRFLRLLVRSRNQKTIYNLHLNQFVATVLMFATLPLSMVYFLTTNHSLVYKLSWLGLQLLFISLLSFLLELLLTRTKYYARASAVEKMALMSYSLLSLTSNSLRFTDPWSIERRLIMKFTFFLSLPALLGLSLTYLTNWHVEANLLPNMELLIQIAVGALMIHVAIEFLEKYFRMHRYATLFTYVRVVLGIVITFILIK